ncbi:MAG TPA: AMIN domain-containing protein [Desulfobacterales bacterium]|nr:AMIN domain-containing protein [Desulfobacterales bacterium]
MKTLIKQGISLTMIILLGWTLSWAGDAPGGSTYKISDLSLKKTDQNFTVTIKGTGTPTFTTYQLFDPLRVVLDIANASLSAGLKLPLQVNESPVKQITGKLLSAKKPVIAKLEILLDQDWPYKIERQGDNISVILQAVTAPAAKKPVSVAASSPASRKSPAAAKAPVTAPENVLRGIKVERDGKAVKVLLLTDQHIKSFKKVKLLRDKRRPDRFYLDLSAIKSHGLAAIKNVNIGSLARIRTAPRGNGLRIVFDSALDRMFLYKVSRTDKGLLVTITPPPEPAEKTASSPLAPVKEIKHTAAASTDTIGRLLTNLTAGKIKKKPAPPEPHSAAPADHVKAQLKNVGISGDAFADAGYDKQKISVDFYKIDLHNVFRLIGEVSGYNIVVDDSVKGSLTLSLNNVPWDFVLDVIMNLKDLQKEERYHTIVISPKSKNFVWPVSKRKTALQMEAPSNKLQVKIDKQLSQPPEAMAADTFIRRGDRLLAANHNKEALRQYEAAFDKWPHNEELARRISHLCLTKLGYNQKAVDYARQALKLNPVDQEAALQAAIGLANMKKPEARQYFEQAASGRRPSRTALVSYASYLENENDLPKAQRVLARYENLYGSDLNIMVAQARIYDKEKRPQKAVQVYKSILYSGYALNPDMIRYIKGRLAMNAKR